VFQYLYSLYNLANDNGKITANQVITNNDNSQILLTIAQNVSDFGGVHFTVCPLGIYLVAYAVVLKCHRALHETDKHAARSTVKP